MKLREIKTKYEHYFKDEKCRKQGEYKSWYYNGQQWIFTHFRNSKHHGERKLWHDNGHQWEVSHWRDDELHGEYKRWNWSGSLEVHAFDIEGIEIIDFLKNPELFPSTPEEKTMFALKYGNGPFIGDSNETD